MKTIANSKAAIIPQDETGKRRCEILKVATQLFARRGYDGVSIREIADASGILGASLYHHFSSKQELYIEAHAAALEHALVRMRQEIAPLTDPWERLEVACRWHLEMQATSETLPYPMTNDVSALNNAEMRPRLVKDRDAFEGIYKELVADLPLRPDIDRSVFRLSLVTLIHAASEWYRPGRLSAEDLVRQFVTIFRSSSEAQGKTPGLAKAPAKSRAPRK